VALVIGASVIGFAPILVRVSGAGPAATAFWRVLFAVPLLALLTRGAGGPGRAPVLAIGAGIAFALDLGFWHYGIANTSVAKATVLTNLTPVVVTAAAWLFFNQRPSLLFLLAVALAMLGAWIMATARDTGAVGPNPLLGDVLSITTAFWYALYLMAVGAARRSDAASRIMFWSSLTTAPLLLAAALVLGETVRPASTPGWAACLALGVVHVGGQGSIAWALGRLPTATASVVVLVQPVVAAVLGWFIFGEAFRGWQAAGAAVALTGVVLSQWVSEPRTNHS
jgi:drug/metabolite transporter (DMT)-like permease